LLHLATTFYLFEHTSDNSLIPPSSSSVYTCTANNGLAGRLPNEITALPKLDILGLEENQLIGPIPNGWKDGLYRVRLQDNILSGPMPVFPPSMLSIELGNNRLSGPIGTAVTNLPNLKKLNLQENRFTGPIPASLGALTQIKEIRLHGNKFGGAVPGDVCVLRMHNFDFKKLSVDCKEVQCECCVPECPWNGR